MDSTRRPSIGRIVIYKSKIDNGPGNDVVSPAIVIRTEAVASRARRRSAPARRQPRASKPAPAVVTGQETVPSAQKPPRSRRGTKVVPIEEVDPTVTHETAARPDNFVAELPDDETVDLLVFGLGRPYREYAVSRGDQHGQWNWPARS